MTTTARSTPLFTLVYSTIAAPIIWFAQFNIVWAITELGCRANFNNVLFFEPTTQRVLVLLVSVVTTVAAGYAGWLALRAYRGLPADDADDTGTESLYRFMALLGMLLAVLFSATIIVSAVPVFVLPVCDRAA
jgi:hypothetical protein